MISSKAIGKFLYQESFTPDVIPIEGVNVTKWGPGVRERYLKKYGAKNAVTKKGARKSQPAKKSVVKKRAKPRVPTKEAVGYSKSASLVTRRVTGATLTGSVPTSRSLG